MRLFSGYRIDSLLYESDRSLVYRARREADGLAVVIKTLKMDYPEPGEAGRFEREYEFIRSLDEDGVIRQLGFERGDNHAAIVLEDFGGDSLHILSRDMDFSLEDVLDIGARAARALDGVHGAGLLHLDVSPGNIVLNPATGQVKLIDFGLSEVFSKSVSPKPAAGPAQGSLAYMPPERTGRTNLPLDQRADLYSLGATLYELASGAPPFASDDELEILRSHLARDPLPLDGGDAEVPKVVSDIILRLLSKNPDDRYRSARAVAGDLEACLEALGNGEAIASIVPGRDDVSERLLPAYKLHGRDRELGLLRRIMKRTVAGEFGLAFVAGYAGIGKTALVAEAMRSLAGECLPGSGKFEQLRRNVPFSAIAAALGGICRQILAEPEDVLESHRRLLAQALGSVGGVVAAVVPELERVVGPQPPVSRVRTRDAVNRLNLAFGKCLGALSAGDRPVVLFLDDLQWADPASLGLLEYLAGEALPRVCVIGAYRNNEVGGSHPLAALLGKLGRMGSGAETLVLDPLSKESVEELVADTLSCSGREARPLARLVARKTLCNPFSVNQFLALAHAEGLLRFDQENRCWLWDLRGLESLNVADNVAESLLGGVGRIGERALEALQLAACIGGTFDLGLLAKVRGETPEQVLDCLRPALEEGLVLEKRDLLPDCSVAGGRGQGKRYAFLHDRIQRAAYDMLTSRQQADIHLRIGRMLLGMLQAEQGEARLFETVDHLDSGREGIADPRELDQLAGLNLRAGCLAMESAAFAQALEYLRIARQCLPGRAWAERPDLAFDTFKNLAWMEYGNGNYQNAEAAIEAAWPHLDKPEHKAELLCIRVQQESMVGRFAQAVATTKETLRLLGIAVPEADELDGAMAELTGIIQETLRGRPMAEFLDAPEMRDPVYKAATRVMYHGMASAYYADVPFSFWMTMKSVAIGLLHGANAETWYINSAMALGVFGDFQGAYDHAMHGIRMAERFDRKDVQCVCHSLSAHCLHWRVGLDTVNGHLRKSVSLGMQCGEYEYAGYSLCHQLEIGLVKGAPLSYLLEKRNELRDISKVFYSKLVEVGGHVYGCIMNSLSGETNGELMEEFKDVAESSVLMDLDEVGAWYCNSHFMIFKIRHACIHEDIGTVAEIIKEFHVLMDKHETHFIFVIGLFYFSLGHVLLLDGERDESEVWSRETFQEKRMLLKTVAANSPKNYLHYHLLLEAELARIEGRDNEAMDLYDRAIAEAVDNGFLPERALGNELAGRFWLGRGKEHFARLYMERAYHAYRLWGNEAKLRRMEAAHPALLARFLPPENRGGSSLSSHGKGTESSRQEGFDVASVIRAARAISEEIDPEPLLAGIMDVIMQNAGAERGVLVLEREGKLVEAASQGVQDGAMLGEAPLGERSGLPLGIVRYVHRTGESVALGDAGAEGDFTRDPYVLRARPRSILCLPVFGQGERGVLYLENNRIPHAFSPERVEILGALAAQAAISIRNARLIADLTRSERAYRLAESRSRELARRLIRSQEDERRRIARDLHDHLCQNIAGANLQASAILGKKALISPEVRQKIEELCRSLGRSLNDARDLAYGLRPPALDQLGLVPALAKLCGKFADGSGVEVDFLADGVDGAALDPEVEINLYRIVQEGLANIRRHSGAGRACVQLAASPSRIVLRLEDDGRGFDLEARPGNPLGHERMGLGSMRERAELLGGVFKLRTSPEQGVRISVEIPRLEEGGSKVPDPSRQ